MKYFLRRALFWSLVVTILATCSYGIVAGPEQFSGYMFKAGLRTLDGTEVTDLTQVMSNDAVFLFVIYWQTGCPACEKQLDSLTKVAKIPGVAVIAINIGGSENSVRKVADEYPFVFLVGATSPPEAAAGVPQTALYGFNRDTNQWEEVYKWFGYNKEPVDSFLEVINAAE